MILTSECVDTYIIIRMCRCSSECNVNIIDSDMFIIHQNVRPVQSYKNVYLDKDTLTTSLTNAYTLFPLHNTYPSLVPLHKTFLIK